MTPNLGQGAGQALEDAVVLAKTLEAGSGRQVTAGLEAYDRLRRPRTQMIVLRSHRIGAVGQWASPAAVTLRNAGMRLLPRLGLHPVAGPGAGLDRLILVAGA